MSKAQSRNDNHLQSKWAQPRILYNDLKPYQDPGIDCSQSPSLTDQSQAAECDVNNILKRFQQTGILPGVDTKAVFQDVSNVPDYHAAMDIVINAERQFSSLDAHVRKRFNNDPAEFMEFIHDPKKAAEAVKLGLYDIIPQSDNDRVLEALEGLKPQPSGASPESAAGSRKPSQPVENA